jgi:hypothetical protein
VAGVPGGIGDDLFEIPGNSQRDPGLVKCLSLRGVGRLGRWRRGSGGSGDYQFRIAIDESNLNGLAVNCELISAIAVSTTRNIV